LLARKSQCVSSPAETHWPQSKRSGRNQNAQAAIESFGHNQKLRPQ
jgi:hypothetical protein